MTQLRVHVPRATKLGGPFGNLIYQAAGARVISAAVSLAAVPILIRLLGDESFGIFATCTAIVAATAVADLGISPGLLNSLSHARASADAPLAWGLVKSALRRITLVALILGASLTAVGVSLSYLGPESWNVSTTLCVVLGLCVATFLPTTPVLWILTAYDRQREGIWISALANVVGYVLAVSAALALPQRIPSWPVSGYFFGLAAVQALAFLKVAVRLRRIARGCAGGAKALPMPPTPKGDLAFFGLNVSAALNYQIDLVIISAILGPQIAATYAVAQRLPGLFTQTMSQVLNVYWARSARQAAARATDSEVTADYLRVTKWSAMWCVVAAALTAVLTYPAATMWFGVETPPDTALIAGLAASLLVFGVNQPQAMLLNGHGGVRFQAAWAIPLTICNVTLSVALSLWWGMSGPIWGTVIAQVLTMMGPATWWIWRRRWRRPGEDGP